MTRGGIIYPYDLGRKETPRQTAAINHLCEEWDYEYAANKPEEK